ncbi:hypothetical protein Tsubulata_029260 [Turnera subulata]|uniref:Uncharacterized protein n=1 Tax=Turnera subulata TaxID=218843 RepID=A0A9Q0JK77_9ROSI|nr:hypothetical protein Tsubulata_029260 [Turnera subulata]
MKKMKGVAAAPASAAVAVETSPSRYAAVYEDPRSMLKHRGLMQDYAELFKETEAKRTQLLMMRQKKLTLMAEVRFLRRRYKYLTQNQSQNPLMKQNAAEPHKVVTKSKKQGKDRNGNGNDTPLRHLPPRFDLNQKGKIQNEKEPALRTLVPMFDQKQRKKETFRVPAAVPDLNQRDRIYSGMEAAVRNNAPIFDLNQISREEEELQDTGVGMRLEEPKMNSIRGGVDEQHSDMKLSACRNVGNGPSRSGKRKISWQDQVALRV